MSESTITAKGQTTVPLAVRERIGAGPGAKLVWHALPGGMTRAAQRTDSTMLT